jgi:hypothetical protein
MEIISLQLVLSWRWRCQSNGTIILGPDLCIAGFPTMFRLSDYDAAEIDRDILPLRSTCHPPCLLGITSAELRCRPRLAWFDGPVPQSLRPALVDRATQHSTDASGSRRRPRLSAPCGPGRYRSRPFSAQLADVPSQNPHCCWIRSQTSVYRERRSGFPLKTC